MSQRARPTLASLVIDLATAVEKSLRAISLPACQVAKCVEGNVLTASIFVNVRVVDAAVQ